MTDLLKKIRKNVSLAPYTYFGLEGKTTRLIEVNNPTDLKQVVLFAKAKHWPYFILAGGSNIVVSNRKYPGLVIVYRETEEILVEASLIQKGQRLMVFASVPLWKVVKYSIENGLSGLESLSGIPGTLGGAVYGNAGAYGHSISEVVEKVIVFDGKQEKILTRKDCLFAYRDSLFKKKSWVILAIQLKMKPGVRDKMREYSERIIRQRNEKYENVKCPGSFFKNVLVSKVSKNSLKKIDQAKIIDGKIPAGYLLEVVGAKGMRTGGLRIADYHGNLIINDGQAVYRDVEKMVAVLKERVKDKFGIKLEEEVRYLI